VNFDDGLIPAVLTLLARDMELDYVTQGCLSSFLHLGMVLSAFVAGGVFSMFSIRKTLAYSAFATACCVVTFALSPNSFCLLLARMMCGLVASFYVVHAPVYIDDFLPLEVRAKLISFYQVTTNLGIMGGYLTGMITTRIAGVRNENGYWRLPFLIQSLFIIAIGIGFMRCKDEEIEKQSQAEKTSFQGDDFNLVAQFRRYSFVLFNPLFLTITMGLVTLFYVASGIMFWVTSYMTFRFGGPSKVLLIGGLFMLTGTTAPVLGALTGGAIIDAMGGYKGRKYLRRSLIFMFGCALVGSIFIKFEAFMDNIYLFTLCIWAILFFGGCIVAPGSGAALTVCGEEYKHVTSAVSQGMYNLGGYFGAPIMTGIIMESSGMLWGFRGLMFTALFGIIFFGAALFLLDKYYCVATPKFHPSVPLPRASLAETTPLLKMKTKDTTEVAEIKTNFPNIYNSINATPESTDLTSSRLDVI